MSITRHHAEWLSLIEVSGPFLSLPVLTKAFPQGLHPHDSEHAQTLKLAYGEWSEDGNGSSLHRAWIKHVLLNTLGFEESLIAEGQGIPQTLCCESPVPGEVLRPDLIIKDPQSGAPRLLVKVYPRSQDLGKNVVGSRWQKSSETVMSTLLRNVGVRLGLVTNGERWMLVDTPLTEGTSGFASWYAQYWFEEPITLRAFRSLLSAERFFGVPDNETIESLLARSAEDQQEVTNQLGLQVRKAVEVLIQSLDKADLDLNRTLLADINEKQLYESALTVMMRLVFLFCAEERGLLLLGDEMYDRFYAVSTLREQLRSTADQHGEEILERRCDAWVRLLTTFRAVHSGIRHDRLKLPAYGGHLFDPDRFPFLEGRKSGTRWQETSAAPLPVNNRTVLHLLEALQILQVKLPGGGPAESRKLSFRSLGVEQIGHVYEGLLDHTAKRAPETILGLLGAKDKDEEVPLSTLEEKLAKGEKDCLRYLKEVTSRSESALKKALAITPEGEDLSHLRTACQANETLLKRVLPFAGLIRPDPYGYPYVIPEGGVYVTAGMDRRSSGTHYTPPSLTEPIVQHTLEPLLYPEMAEGKSKGESRRLMVEEILNLKICDMAMGSAAFLVQVVRFLAGEIVQRWADAESHARERGETHPKLTAPYADPATGAITEQQIPDDETERMTLAKRLVAERCVYGVDINPMAVEIAKLSIWLETMAKDRPFSFVDHALRCGDSLLGCISLKQIEHFHLDPTLAQKRQPFLTGGKSEDMVAAAAKLAIEKRRKLESFVVNDARDAERKSHLLAEAESAMETLHLAGDLLIGAALRVARQEGDYKNFEDLSQKLLDDHLQFALDPLTREVEREAHREILEVFARYVLSFRGLTDPPMNPFSEAREAFFKQLHLVPLVSDALRHPFHWSIEFPEVFEQGGFDAIVGNPPFQGGQKITGTMGTDYRDYLVEHIAAGRRGSADLCAYFFLRAKALLKSGGGMGLLSTNTISQGDTREVGLEALCGDGKEVAAPDEALDDLESGRLRFVNKRNWLIPAMPGGPDQGTTAVIHRAIPSRKWPGQANLEVAEVWIRKGEWKGPFILADKAVNGITPFLSIPGKATGTPYRLKANEGKSFQGSNVLGIGFTMPPEKAQSLIAQNPKNRNVLSPYLNGEDLNSRPDQSSSRWVINFHDWPLDRSSEGHWLKAVTSGSKEAKKMIKEWLQSGHVPTDYPDPVAADYPDCLQIVVEKVKPERDKLAVGDATARDRARRWWQFARPTMTLYATITEMDRVIALSLVNNHLGFDWVPNEITYAHRLVIFALVRTASFTVIQSSFHYHWAWKYSSTLRRDINYSPSDCFETFPFPNGMVEDASLINPDLESIGEQYHEHRRRIMLNRGEGLTTTYNRFHNQNETSTDIAELRRLHVAMDQAVAAAYRWNDLDLDHGFHETKQGVRYTVCPHARQEILDRLLELNHARYDEEVRLGLHEKKGSKPDRKLKEEGLDNNSFTEGLFSYRED